MIDVLRYIEKMKEMYEGERITAQEPRTLLAEYKPGDAEIELNLTVQHHVDELRHCIAAVESAGERALKELAHAECSVAVVLARDCHTRDCKRHLAFELQRKGRVQDCRRRWAGIAHVDYHGRIRCELTRGGGEGG